MIIKINLLIFLNWIRGHYTNWLYWKSVFRTMRKKVNKLKLNKQDQIYINKSGIAFSFDDSFRLDNWYNYGKEMFGYYDVKVTFNINAFHHFENQRNHTQNEIDKLIELQSNGHEISHHGFKHRKATIYSSENGLCKWVEDDIISLFNWMDKQTHSITKEKFKKPVSFAFPYFTYNEDTVNELVPRFFKIVRGHLYNNNLTPFNHTGLAPSICIDSNLLTNVKYIKKIMKIAKRTGQNLILTCHSVLPKEVSWEDFGWQGEEAKKAGNWRISPDTLKAIINEARKNDFEFYTTSEIAGVATFIDPNFEKCVRKIISNSSSQWISITELSLIKELDLSNNQISNLDGIQYFLNLEKLNLSNNNITDFRLLEKLPKLKKVEIIKNSKDKKSEEARVI